MIMMRCGESPILLMVWSMSGVANVLFYRQCGGYLVWWMFDVVDIWCGGCLCGGCCTIPKI